MKRLMIDARWLDSGLGAYTLNIVRGLHEASGFQTCLLTRSQHVAELTGYGYDMAVADAPIYSAQEQWSVLRAASKFDVLHVPHYNVPLLRRGALLVTIHDLTHIVDPTHRKRLASWVYAQPVLRLAAKRADHIFTVSEYSKRRIAELLSIEPSKITVTFSGVGPHIHPEDRGESEKLLAASFGITEPFLLFVGNLKPNKNVAGLLQAFAVLVERRKLPHKLMIIGDDSHFRRLLQESTRELGIGERVVFAGRVSDEQLRRAYSAAVLTVLPSFEEGFGLPVVESMRCGTPVACSSVASLPEVGGDAAEYFSPHDVESIVAAFERVLLDPSRWRELQRRGFQQAERFTWSACAIRHFPVYHEYLSN
jgi:glycosyltransferase involved in cell wall biosynthesis